MSEILFEFFRQGAYVKVTAIEASVVVPAGLSEDQMKFQALNKLKYVLRKAEQS